MKTLLVTGGAGFIGSNFIKYILNRFEAIKVINLDLLTYAGNLNNLKEIEKDPRYRFVKMDVRDRSSVKGLFEQNQIDWVVNFAAESHVDRSIEDPETFLTTNIIGTQVLLDCAKGQWKVKPDDKYDFTYVDGVRFLQVSTDEVYGSLGAEGLFTETTPLSPNSPYSAAKASADMIVRAYHETFGMPVVITRCSNNYGPYQFPEKLIPLMVNNAEHNKSLPVYGDGLQIRDWLYVEDHCSAIVTVLEQGADGEVYNIGGNNEKANIDIVKLILRTLEQPETLIQYVKDRPGHDRRYAIDNAKITRELGWQPAYSFEEGMARTIAWYRSNHEWMDNIVSGTYMTYYDSMYQQAMED